MRAGAWPHEPAVDRPSTLFHTRPHHGPIIEALEAPDSRPSNERVPAPFPEDVLAAFRDVHARSLHGFALLLTLGDRPQASRLAESALARASGRVGELRHPERAAAWLRRHVVRGARTGRLRRRAPASRLAELGADAAMMRALASLSPRERAALLASDVERLDRRDVASVVARDGSALGGPPSTREGAILPRLPRRSTGRSAGRPHRPPHPGDRSPAHDVSVLHEDFARWLIEGARDEPARDVAHPRVSVP